MAALADLSERGIDPYTHHVATARTAALRHEPGTFADGAAAITAVRDTPDPDLAAELATRHPTHLNLARAIVEQVALIGTDVWYRAWEGRPASLAPMPVSPTAHDLATIDALCGRSWDIVRTTGNQPLNASTGALATAASTLGRPGGPSPDTPLSGASHALRIAWHPATGPQDRTKAAHAALALVARATASGDPRETTLATMARLAQCATTERDRINVLQHTPLRELTQAANQARLGEVVASHLISALRQLTPHALVAALRLEPTFTGTVGELLATATTITAP